jgi:ketosteroid isomerase-like protein
MAEELSTFLDECWRNGTVPTFYDLEDRYRGRKFDRMQLIFACWVDPLGAVALTTLPSTVSKVSSTADAKSRSHTGAVTVARATRGPKPRRRNVMPLTVGELIEKFDELMNAREFDALMDLHSAEYKVVSNGKTITGREAVLSFYKESYGTGLKSDLLEEIPVTPDVKILRVSWKDSNGNGRAISIVRKEAGAWKFFYDNIE